MVQVEQLWKSLAGKQARRNAHGHERKHTHKKKKKTGVPMTTGLGRTGGFRTCGSARIKHSLFQAVVKIAAKTQRSPKLMTEHRPERNS